MWQVFKNAQGSIILRGKLRDSATGNGKIGLTFASTGLVISTIADNEATPTVYTVADSTIETITTLGAYVAPTATKCRFKLVHDTNHPGICEFQFADARFAVAGAKSLLISVSGVTGMSDMDGLVPLTATNPYDGIRGGMTAFPNVATANIGSLPTGDASGRVDVGKTRGAALICQPGYIGIDWGSIYNSLAQVKLANTFLNGVSFGTVVSANSNSIVVQFALGNDDIVKGSKVIIISGTGQGQSRIITNYVDASLTLVVGRNWTITPDNTSVYFILYDTGPKVDDNLAAYVSSGGGTNQISLAAGKVLLQAVQTGVTIPTVTNLTNFATVGDFTAAMKTSLNAATPVSVGDVTGKVLGGGAGVITGIGVKSTVGAFTVGIITDAAFTVPTDGTGQATGILGMIFWLYNRFFGKTVYDKTNNNLKTFQVGGATRTTQTTSTDVTKDEVDAAT